MMFFKGGVEGKRQVDKVIDKCDSMQVLVSVFSLRFCMQLEF